MIDWGKPTRERPEELREHLPEWVAERCEVFDIPGAGLLMISKRAGHGCGSAKNGFSIKCSWGSYGLAGGVIDGDDARRLADHIYAALSELDTPS